MADNATRKAAALVIAAALAVPAEGLRKWAYYDPPGILSVCFGHTGEDVDKSREYTLTECKDLLSKDMLSAISAVESCRPGLPINVLAAFSDAVYNIGPTVACDTARSTAARKLAARDYAGACRELSRWNKANVGGIMVALPGLTARREKERELCISGVTL